jgi:hypothetical protein
LIYEIAQGNHPFAGLGKIGFMLEAQLVPPDKRDEIVAMYQEGGYTEIWEDYIAAAADGWKEKVVPGMVLYGLYHLGIDTVSDPTNLLGPLAKVVDGLALAKDAGFAQDLLLAVGKVLSGGDDILGFNPGMEAVKLITDKLRKTRFGGQLEKDLRELLDRIIDSFGDETGSGRSGTLARSEPASRAGGSAKLAPTAQSWRAASSEPRASRTTGPGPKPAPARRSRGASMPAPPAGMASTDRTPLPRAIESPARGFSGSPSPGPALAKRRSPLRISPQQQLELELGEYEARRYAGLPSVPSDQLRLYLDWKALQPRGAETSPAAYYRAVNGSGRRYAVEMTRR